MADEDDTALASTSAAAAKGEPSTSEKGNVLANTAKRGRSSTPIVDFEIGSPDHSTIPEGPEGATNVHHDDLEAYREARRMSRNSSKMRISSASHREEEPDQGQDDIGGVRGQASTAPAAAQICEATSSAKPRNKKDVEVEKRSGPACLVNCTQKIEACTESIQAWTDRLEENARTKKDAKRDAAVVIAEDGTVIEPKGDTWLQRKFMVIVVFIILFWVYIVYVWRICVAGIRMEPRATVTRAEGIGLLVGFHVIWLTVIWSYIRVLLASPGYVRDHIAISEPPQPIDQYYYPNQTSSSQVTSEGPPQTISSNDQPDETVPVTKEEAIDPSVPAIVGPIGASQAAGADEERQMQKEAPSQPYWATHNQQPSASTEGGVAEPMRMPPQSAPLHPVNTYCYRCKRYKPHRAHHCRHCATCVLKMDHHCPWVGGCVGARNHKFFYHFLQWVTMLEIYVLVSNAVAFTRGLQRRRSIIQGWSIDGYMISLFPICAMFLLFTGALVITHSYLFILNITTIEHMAYSRITTREEILLSRYLDAREDNEGIKLDFRQKLKEKSRIKKKWAMQWGNLKTEANLWWLDDRQEALVNGQPRTWYHSISPNWKLALGDGWYEWILPLGRSKSDGLSYETNWRFGQGGLWRTREEWSEKKAE